MKQLATVCLVITALVGATSPASAQSREQRQMMATLQMLQEQAQQLAITMAALQQSLDESVKTLNGRIDEVNNAQRRGFADQKVSIDNIGSEMNRVRQTADDTNVRVASLRDEIEAVRATVLALPQQLAPVAAPIDPNAPPAAAPAPGAAATPPAVTPAPAPAPTQPPAVSVAGLSPTRMFETARLDYFNQQYAVAISGFEQLLKAFPRAEVADDAQYYIGDAHFAEKRMPQAVAAYNAVIQNYPNSDSVPIALYKRGLAQDSLGLTDAARASWEQLVKQFGASQEAQLARQGLDRIAARRP